MAKPSAESLADGLDAVDSFDELLRMAADTSVEPPAPAFEHGDELCGGRFLVERQLGQGGMGVVYLALDRERDERVALKTLVRMAPEDISRLKAEFRALADVTHENLVGLHELFCDRDRWFFTMDLIDGTTLLEFLRGSSDGDAQYASTMRSSPPNDAQAGHATVSPARELDVLQVRDTFRQLVEAVSAIHTAGQVHRDLKPSNVMVDRNGRVQVLDFGLVVPHLGADFSSSTRRLVAGTPAYMAPEQAAAEAVLPASDWYAVGCMLYEVLTGQLPFEGAPVDMLSDKQLRDAPSPARFARALPEDLSELCTALLARAPEARPGPELIRRVLGAAAPRRRTVPPGGIEDHDQPFVGRAAELAQLSDALARAREGAPVAFFVHGASGTGKSRLIRHFLGEHAAALRPLVLSGRCYEHEAVPYKALDTIIDALVDYLEGQPADTRAALLPDDFHALTRLFPVLARLSARRDVAIVEPLELRFRALSALKQLLGRIAQRALVVLQVDDLQWGDLDSAELLIELLQPPDAPALLFLGNYRSDDRERSAFLRRLTALGHVDRLPLQELALGPLDHDACTELARRLLGDDAGPERARAIAEESDGNPYFAAELASHAKEGGASTRALGSPTLVRMIEERVSVLGDDERRLLKVVALAGRPVPQWVAMAAAGLARAGKSVRLLRTERLLRTFGARGVDSIECYHDRIRETVTASLSAPDAQQVHLRLAETLELHARAEAEMIAEHYLAAGARERAAPFAVEAAGAAAAALAFDRAARLYALAVELSAGDQPSRRLLLTKRAEALVGAGRGADAAEAFLEAVQGAGAHEGLELQRRAAEQLMKTGYYRRGQELLREVLIGSGLVYPERTPALVFAIVQRTLQLRLRGFRFIERAPELVPAGELARLETCWSAAWSLWIVDPLRFALYTLEYSLRSLRSGERNAIARARAIYALTLVLEGPSKHAAAMSHVAAARELARDGETRAYVKLIEGVVHSQAYEQAASLEAADEAVQMLSDGCVGVSFEMTLARVTAFSALTALGRFGELRRRVDPFAREMEGRDNFAALQAATFVGVATLMEDGDTGVAAERLRVAMTRVPPQARKDFITATITMELYAGHPEVAWKTMRELEREVGSHGGRSKLYSTRIEYQLRRGQCAIAMAHRQPDDGPRYLRSAQRSVKRLERERTTVADAYAALLRAGIAETRGMQLAARTALSEAHALFDRAGLPGYRAVAGHRLAELGARDPGAEADVCRALGIANPRRLCAIYGLG